MYTVYVPSMLCAFTNTYINTLYSCTFTSPSKIIFFRLPKEPLTHIRPSNKEYESNIFLFSLINFSNSVVFLCLDSVS